MSIDKHINNNIPASGWFRSTYFLYALRISFFSAPGGRSWAEGTASTTLINNPKQTKNKYLEKQYKRKTKT